MPLRQIPCVGPVFLREPYKKKLLIIVVRVLLIPLPDVLNGFIIVTVNAVMDLVVPRDMFAKLNG